MKKSFRSTVFCCLVLLCSARLSAQNLLLPFLSDSSHYYLYDPNSGSLQVYARSINRYNADNLFQGSDRYNYFSSSSAFYRDTTEYDAAKRVIRETSFRSDNGLPTGPMSNFLKNDYVYDDQDRLLDILGQFGNATGGWDNYYHQVFGFDDVQHRDSSVYTLWDNTAQAWENYRRDFAAYNPDGQPYQQLEDEWDDDEDEWTPLHKNYFSYLPDGKLLVHDHESYFDDGTVVLQKDSSLYLPDGRLDSLFYESWIPAQSFHSQAITKFWYDANADLELQTTVSSSNGGTSWNLVNRRLYAPGDGYYSDDYAMEASEVYSATINDFVTNSKTTRTFIPLSADRVLYVERYEILGTGGNLSPNYVDSVWYRLPTVATHSPAAGRTADCQFANPFQSGNWLVCQAPDPTAMLDLRISDAMGRIVCQTQARPGEAWQPPNRLPAGLYVLTVWQKGRYLGVRRMVVND